MHHFFDSVLTPIFRLTTPTIIVEIGAEQGKHTRRLLEYCTSTKALLHVIDPVPTNEILTLQEENPTHMLLHQGASLDVLQKLTGYDAVLIDGDHNWYTVFHELQYIEREAKRRGVFPLVFLHDVEWPYGRRDLYYAPERIPATYRHPYSQQVVAHGSAHLLPTGIGNENYVHALEEGGPRNGVRTAVEDFLRESSLSLSFIVIPGLHGLGILCSKDFLQQHPALEQVLQRWQEPSLIAHIAEMNRAYDQQLTTATLTRTGAKAAYLRLDSERCDREDAQKTLERMQQKHQEERVKLQSEQEKIDQLRKDYLSVAGDLRSMRQSRSWRWTQWCRRIEQWIRRSIWSAAIDQDERTVTALPSSTTQVVDAQPAPMEPPPRQRPPDVAVIIPCHNYSHFLVEALESVLWQTQSPAEVVVVDDASSDATRDIARAYESQGVRYLRGEWKSVCAARNGGAMATGAPFLIFLDADDILPPNYLELCRATMEDPTIAIAYGDMQEFGEGKELRRMPEYDHAHLVRENYISSHAMLRRQVFDLVGGFHEFQNAHEDWDLWRRMMSFSWRAKKIRTTVRYRLHPESRLHCAAKATKWSYCFNASLLEHPITIFTPFAGRREVLESYLKGLRSLRFRPELIRLHWFDTSGDPAFGEMLRTTMGTLPFGRTTYSAAPLPSLWKHTPQSLIEQRVSNAKNAQYYYELAVVRAYNHFLQSCDTEYALTLEDDIRLSPDALTRMFETFEIDTVAVVAPYRCHIRGYYLSWTFDTSGHMAFPRERKQGVTHVDGSGFGCSLFRMGALKSLPIRTEVFQTPQKWYDSLAFEHLRSKGKILCNWDIDVFHIETNRYAPRPE